MAFVLIPPLIVLVGGRVDVQDAVRIRFGLLLGVKFILGKGPFCFVFAATGEESKLLKSLS